jgi:hypothetical protein
VVVAKPDHRSHWEPQHLVGQDQMQPIMGKKYQSRNPSENFSPQKVAQRLQYGCLSPGQRHLAGRVETVDVASMRREPPLTSHALGKHAVQAGADLIPARRRSWRLAP